MVESLLEIFVPKRFVGPPKPPKRWDKPDQKPGRLWTREFTLLFMMTMCANSFIAVYYCFEQWMEGLGIGANWRGVLLSALFAMLLLFRPIASVVMRKHGKFWPMVFSMAVSVGVMLSYPHVPMANAVPIIFAMRIVQGIALAVFSACIVGVLVECIPPGQSARGFAIFSLTMLLPYSIIPGLSEKLLPLVGGEANLFASMAWLGLPSFIMLLLLAKKLRQPETAAMGGDDQSLKDIIHSVGHSGLGFVYLGCLFFSMTTVMAIFFMKGLCGLTGAHPAWFFTTYSVTIILVRIFGSHMLDTLPRYRVSVLCSGALALIMLAFSHAGGWIFIPLSCLYGLSIGLLYPLMAAAVFDRSTPDTRSINSNVMYAAFDASGMFAPMLGGGVIAAGFGYEGVFCAAAATAAMCGVAMLVDRARMRKRERFRG